MLKGLTEKFSSLKQTLLGKWKGLGKNSGKQESFSTKKESETFVSNIETYGNKTFKYVWLNKFKNEVNEFIAFVKNHPKYVPYRNYLIDFVWTGFVMAWIVYSLPQRQPFLRGFGIAVLIIVTQTYITWFVRLIKNRRY